VRRRLQLVISRPIVEEYLGVLEMLGADSKNLADLENYFATANTVTQVNLGKRLFLSRDSDDNKFLSTAHVGKAKYIVSRDNDLLDIPKTDLQGLRFQIVSPFELLQQLEEL
jgi:putative PIN family toxin of toxin-antitoxin system